MSKTAFYANMIKQQLENIEPSLNVSDPVHKTVTYLLNRLWPDLESRKVGIRFTHQDPIDCGLPSAFLGSGQTIR